MKRGKFIVFEGLNGCGKGTQLQKLTEYIYDLSRANTIFRTREPNEFDENGKMARYILASDNDPYENGLAAVGYFGNNRVTHNEIFRPMLTTGIDVLCDRYWHSNFAFQNTQGISYEEIAEANKNSMSPDLTYIFNTSSEECIRRLKERDGGKGRKFDLTLDFNKKVLNNYLELRNILPNILGDKSIIYIDGMQSVENVWKAVQKAFNEKFKD
ncbi:MAG: dTMP kinase [Nanoarchaeota archaeon]|nr:dTMP kinase [Nanoarchaeota archaeon]